MKAWKIIAVAAFAVIGVALVTATAFAYMGRPVTNSPYDTYNPYGYGLNAPPQGPRGGMMDGMMGSGYPSHGGYQAYPQQTPYKQEYGQWTGGYGGCPMRNGRG